MRPSKIPNSVDTPNYSFRLPGKPGDWRIVAISGDKAVAETDAATPKMMVFSDVVQKGDVRFTEGKDWRAVVMSLDDHRDVVVSVRATSKHGTTAWVDYVASCIRESLKTTAQ